MSHRYTDNDLDNALFAEVLSDRPDLNAIRRLVAEGANVNALDTAGDPVLWCAIRYLPDQADLTLIVLLIELGADVNYDEGGRWFNCLYYAGLTQRPDLILLLLKAGASPNCVSDEDGYRESLLDWARFDQQYEEQERPDSSGKRMAKIVRLLGEYGAKPLCELEPKIHGV